MTTHKMHELQGQFYWVTGIPLDDGMWGAYAYFERVADYSSGEPVPCKRLTVQGKWESREEAEKRGEVIAAELIKDGRSGL